ncbi:hypothetical protein BJX68DRAFT_259746 [Aspergillus pseudodeflectus]|uniref:Uncharacterized protein n=1 Tax=Aspergillus pseudodeflectus TaxID=176178 RepID=A0ABR4JA86_9EURO
MESLHSRVPYAQWRLKVFRQLFCSSNGSNKSLQPRRLYSTSPEDSETKPTPEKQFDHKRNHNRSHKGQPEPSPSKRPSELLPQSPLITRPHPGRDVRHRKKRIANSADFTRLNKNPWAMALASPVRYCELSSTRMPRAFLTEWAPVLDPESLPTPASALWLLPIELLQDDLVEPQLTKADGRALPAPYLKLRMHDRMSILQDMAQHIWRARNQKIWPITKLLPSRWRTQVGWGTKEDARVRWRLDMPKFMRRTLRAYVMKHLQRVSGIFEIQDVRFGVWTSIDVRAPYSEEALVEGLKGLQSFERMGEGAVWILGDCDSKTDLPEFIEVPAIGSKVPVFDFTRLFSKTELEEIRGYSTRFQKFAVFFRPTNERTVETALALWKLQGYMRKPAP